MKRKEKFRQGQIYHIFNKSIANYGIFNSIELGQKFIDRLVYYNSKSVKDSFSKFLEKNENFVFENPLLLIDLSLVKIIAYVIMPDHYHLLLKILDKSFLSKYLSDVENSFSKYLNTKNERKGPLWQSRFKAVRIKNDDQLLHISRYIHLNPTTNSLVEKPEDWILSSYKECIMNLKILKETITEISIKNPKKYQQFVENRIDYQRKLKIIKRLILE